MRLKEVSDFVYARHVVAAVEAADGQIFTGFCMEGTCGVFHLCAERAASSTCINNQDKPRSSALLLSRQASYGEGSGMPCGACREFLLELDAENRHLEFMVDYESRKTITLGELMPFGGAKNGLVKRE